jgi:PPOX class probable F420-dependent enzyme
VDSAATGDVAGVMAHPELRRQTRNRLVAEALQRWLADAAVFEAEFGLRLDPGAPERFGEGAMLKARAASAGVALPRRRSRLGTEEHTMGTMSPAAWRAFLVDGSRTAKVATVAKDGRPSVVPVWFDLDGDDLVFETAGDSAKARHIEANPMVSVCVDDERFPFAFVSVTGRARIEQLAPPEMLTWTTRLSLRYVGAERADEYGRRNAVEGAVLVHVALHHVVAVDNVAA